MNQDGIIDVVIHNWVESTQVAWIAVETGWPRRLLNNDDPNDTIVPSNEYDWNGTHFPFYNSGVGHHEGTYGFAKRNNDGKYNYAWMHFYIDRTSISQVSVCVDRYAYCTIPDYPLHWGQSSLNWSVEENTEVSTSVHPNPNNGSFYVSLSNNEDEITGIKVFDTMGKIIYSNNRFNGGAIVLPNAKQGLYYVVVTLKDKTITEKIIIQ